LNGMKLRLLAMGCVLIGVGTALYFARGLVYALILPVVGIVLIVAGAIYPSRARQKAVTE
jgi:hypothetical protein